MSTAPDAPGQAGPKVDLASRRRVGDDALMTDLLRRHPLLLIVLAQLSGTSLWFSVNGVGLALSRDLGLAEADLGRLTLTVQAGCLSSTSTSTAPSSLNILTWYCPRLTRGKCT